MQANRLTRITGLEALPQLQELYVSENGISELSGLEAQVRRTPIMLSLTLTYGSPRRNSG